MAIDGSSIRSRRTVLTAALGAGLATIASAVGRPLRANAADGDAMVIGEVNDASSTTTLRTPEDGPAALSVVTGDHEFFKGTAIVADGGNRGIYAFGGLRAGVEAVSFEGPGVIARSHGANGVIGVLGSFDDVPARPAGVLGVGGQYDPGVAGVGTAVGVRGEATSGTGVLGTATTGWALRAFGKVKLEKSAGLATIASGTNSVTVTPGIDLTATSAVLVTLQGNAGGTTTVRRVSTNTTTNQFTIFLTANSRYTVKVAWLVLG
jgi:hypothetical protein